MCSYLTNEYLKVFKEARSYLANGWCSYMLACDSSGKATQPYSNKAVKFCAEGALRRAFINHNIYFNIRAVVPFIDMMGIDISDFDDIVRNPYYDMIFYFSPHRETDLGKKFLKMIYINNERGQAAILALFDRGIKNMEKTLVELKQHHRVHVKQQDLLPQAA